MVKKWLILTVILVIAGVLVSGCSDNKEDAPVNEEENITKDVTAGSTTTGSGQDYAVRMEYYGAMKPDEIEINAGDTIAWRNYKPQGTYTLVSNQGLFEDQVMDSNDAYSYTFTQSGTYNFSVADYPDMTLTVTVR